MSRIQVHQAWQRVKVGTQHCLWIFDATALSLAFAVLLPRALHWPLLQFLQKMQCHREKEKRKDYAFWR